MEVDVEKGLRQLPQDRQVAVMFKVLYDLEDKLKRKLYHILASLIGEKK